VPIVTGAQIKPDREKISYDACVIALLLAWRVQLLLSAPATTSDSRSWQYAAYVCALVAIIIAYIMVDFIGRMRRYTRMSSMLKIVLIAAAVVSTSAAPAVYFIYERVQAGGIYTNNEHDGGVWLTEGAARRLLAGENPYDTTYFEEMKRHPSHESLHHYPYGPLNFIMAAPIMALMQRWLGWYDQRVLYLGVLVWLAIACRLLTRDEKNRRLLPIVLFLNPLMLNQFVRGYNDSLMFAFLLLALILASRGKTAGASMAMGASLMVKQNAVFAVLPWLLHVYIGGRNQEKRHRRVRRFLLSGLIPCAVTCAVVCLPFFLWSPTDFIDDYVLFLLGMSPLGRIPIRADKTAWGLGKLILAGGIVQGPLAPMPLPVTTLMFGVGILALLVIKCVMQRTRNTQASVASSAGVLLLLVSFFGRRFHGNYVGLAFWLLSIGWFGDRLQEHCDENHDVAYTPHCEGQLLC